MQQLLKYGKILFTIAIAVFGLIHLITQNVMTALLPVPIALQGRAFFIFFTGIVFIIAATCIFINKIAKIAAVALGLLWF
ncbi:MAG: hypothetical protein ABJA79_07730, partial [Parafilimonas sp.]